MSRTDSAEKVLKWFRRDTAKHEMQVIHNQGLHRHIRFKTPGTSACYFDIVTWPGYLAYSGDMGCFVFARVQDMLDFFRHKISADGEIPINPQYWHEKLQGVDRADGVKEYSADRFREALVWHLKLSKDSMPTDREKRHELFQAIRDEVWGMADEGQDAAMRAACYFEHDGFQFSDFWERDCTKYTTRYLWCCYALVWAVSKYDEAMQKTQVAA